jgi:N-acyl-L-homoserine lactone synthetase
MRCYRMLDRPRSGREHGREAERMIFVVNAENRRLFEADLAEMYRQRKQVFVDRIGWNLPVVTDMEMDRYDREDTLYLLAKDHAQGAVRASVRLLGTDGPHLMSDLFAQACGNGSPRGPTIWEVSRFCTAPSALARRERLELLWEVTCGVIEVSLLYGVDQVIFAANRALLPLMLRCGWDARRLGPTLPDGNDEVTAVAAQICTDALRSLRNRHGVAAPALSFHAGPTRDHVRMAPGRVPDARRESVVNGWHGCGAT